MSVPPDVAVSQGFSILGGEEVKVSIDYKEKLKNEFYDIRYLNTDVDIEKIISRLLFLKGGKFLFYGAAGSGKSLLGAYMAKKLRKEFHLVTGSDLLGRYSGESEKQIRDIFDLATDNDYVLCIDEIGYFLGDRRNFTHAWETSQVNEFLTRLELFDGIFIGTTNYELEEYIDHAFYRRFDLKVKFDYLKPDQAKSLFRDTLKHNNVDVQGSKLSNCYSTLNQLTKVTPSDFSLAARKARFLYDRLTPSVLIELLAAEVMIKPDVVHRKIGFV